MKSKTKIERTKVDETGYRPGRFRVSHETNEEPRPATVRYWTLEDIESRITAQVLDKERRIAACDARIAKLQHIKAQIEAEMIANPEGSPPPDPVEETP